MKSKKTKRVKVKKLKLSAFFGIVFCVLLIGFSVFIIYNKPIKHIKIIGTNLLSDLEIIEIANIKNYPPIYQISKSGTEKNISSLALVDNVRIRRKLNGILIIEIKENTPLFYNRSANKVILSNGKQTDITSKYLGIPTLVNYTQDTVYEKLIDGLAKIDYTIISLISEIEYFPFKSGDTIIDDTRFLLHMNDGNTVHINIINISKLNNYRELFASIEEGAWRIFLDSAADTVSIRPLNEDMRESNETEN